MTAKTPTEKAVARAKKIVKRHNRFTARENARFEALPPWQKRVQIARDVLAQIEVKRIEPTHGIYLKNTDGRVTEVPPSQQDKEVSEVFAGMDSCKACALGSLFVCAVDRADKLKVKDLIPKSNNYQAPGTSIDVARHSGQENMHSYLEPFFSRKQLWLIERAFEHTSSYEGGKFNVYRNWNLNDADLCLERILRNIIRHKGIFQPNDPDDKASLKKLIRKQNQEE